MRIGILGGSFDPVHEGHLRLAEAARDQLGLDRVVLVPNSRNPLKPSASSRPAERLRRVRLAVRGLRGLEVSDYEARRPAPSFTIDTVEHLRRLHGPGAVLYLLIGADSCADLPRWKAVDRLLRLCRLVVASRPGYRPARYPRQAIRLVFDAVDISSTRIRSGRRLAAA